MSNLYRFSPIETEEKIAEVYQYLNDELQKLSMEILKQSLPINTLKIFAHYFNEYNYLSGFITKKGPSAPFNSRTSFYAQVNETIGESKIKYLGVRVVDPYRLQVGCGDFEIENYLEIKNKYLNASPYIREIKGDIEMLELWHPDFDVLGYIVPPLN